MELQEAIEPNILAAAAETDQPSKNPAASTAETPSVAPVHLLDPDGPTSATYSAIEHAYDYFNQTLFGGILPGALITLRADRKSLSFYHYQRFANESGQLVDELALNSAYFGIWPIECTLSVLVHEMCHQAMNHRSNVKPASKNPCYHSKEWADQMIAVGLFPSSTGRPGGKSTGAAIGHYIIVGGYFEVACQALKSTQFGLHWYDRYPSTEALETAKIISAAPARPETSTESHTDDEAEDDFVEYKTFSIPNANPSPVAQQLIVVNDQIDAKKKAALAGGPVKAAVKEQAAQRPFPIKTGFEVSETRKHFDKEDDATAFVIQEQFIEVPMSVVKPVIDGAKVKAKITYECPSCHSRVWGKPSLSVLCGCTAAHPQMLAKD